MAKMNSIQAIKAFFENGGRKVSTKELKDLSMDDRIELAKLCCAELGVEFSPPKVKIKK